MIKECPHCKNDIQYNIPQQFGGHITNCKENPNRKLIIEKGNETKHNNLYDKYDLKCLYCNKEYILELTKNQFNGGRYSKCCSIICAHKYTSSFVDHNKLKESKCKICNDIVFIKLNASHVNTVCENCNKNYKVDRKKISKIKNNNIKNFKIVNNIIRCNVCGQQECKNKICKTWINGRSKIFIKLGFNIVYLDSTDFYSEYDRIVNLLKTEYEFMSMVEIGEKYNINYQTIQSIFKSLNLSSRTHKESAIFAYKTGRQQLSETTMYPYKSGYHTSWENKKIWYRSSYELSYCKYLDDNNIEYNVESLRIEYYDSIKKYNRIAIPDFLLLKTNEIVEIKSNWTYNEQNMKDKIIAYKNNGYNVKLILDNKEYIM